MATRNRQNGADLRTRIDALETELAALRRRLDRLEGDARQEMPRPAPPTRAVVAGPRCPGCRLVVDEPRERCAYCLLPFRLLPAALRPAFPSAPVASAPGTKAKPAPAKRGGGGAAPGPGQKRPAASARGKGRAAGKVAQTRRAR